MVQVTDSENGEISLDDGESWNLVIGLIQRKSTAGEGGMGLECVCAYLPSLW